MTPEFLVERIATLTVKDARIIVRRHQEFFGMVDSMQKNGEDMMLAEDHRKRWDDIEQMLTTDLSAGWLLIESIRKILNVAFASHELTSEHIEEVLAFWT